METKDILKELRRKAGYNSMQNFCSNIDINFSTYQNYESGKRIPTAEILIKLADFYGVTTDYLLGREPSPNPFADLDLSEDDEAEVIAKYMSLPPEIRACMLDVLVQLGDAAKKRQNKTVQSNAQSQSEQIQRNDTYGFSDRAIAKSSESNYKPAPTDEQYNSFEELTDDMLGE